MSLEHRVLVIDDDDMNLFLIGRRLEASGYIHKLVSTGQEGLEHALSEPYGCLLLDLRLPDIDGTAILTRLQQERPRLPVVVMTAHGSPEVERQVRAAGATAYLLKPVRRQELIETVAAAVEKGAGP